MEPRIEHEHSHNGDSYWQAVRAELACHFPYAVFSTAMALACLGFTTYASGPELVGAARTQANALFHSFHFMHILFAVTGSLITFLRNSRNMLAALVVGVISPTIFCVLSDAILPYFAGRMMGIDMHFHLCFVSELANVLPFLVIGVVNGFVMSSHNQGRQSYYSIFSHAIHIFVSSLASSFYLVSHGLTDYLSNIGVVFLFLVVVVVVPCTLSDVVVPMALARVGKRNEKHSS